MVYTKRFRGVLCPEKPISIFLDAPDASFGARPKIQKSTFCAENSTETLASHANIQVQSIACGRHLNSSQSRTQGPLAFESAGWRQERR